MSNDQLREAARIYATAKRRKKSTPSDIELARQNMLKVRLDGSIERALEEGLDASRASSSAALLGGAE